MLFASFLMCLDWHHLNVLELGDGIFFSTVRYNGYIIMAQTSDENVVSHEDEVGIKVREDSNVS